MENNITNYVLMAKDLKEVRHKLLELALLLPEDSRSRHEINEACGHLWSAHSGSLCIIDDRPLDET